MVNSKVKDLKSLLWTIDYGLLTMDYGRFIINMTRYFTYSSILHLLILGGIILTHSIGSQTKKYYTIDFLGGSSLAGQGSIPQAPIQKSEPELKVKTVNPKEDLLIKSKKKSPPSIPIPKAPSKGIVSAQTGSVPGIHGKEGGSGLGIGVGHGGFGSGGFGAGNFPYTWYVHTVKKKLDSNWNVTAGFSAKTYAQMTFIITRNGMLKEIRIEESSKNDIFDLAAVRAVETSNPLPPLPSDFPESELRVHVKFTVKR